MYIAKGICTAGRRSYTLVRDSRGMNCCLCGSIRHDFLQPLLKTYSRNVWVWKDRTNDRQPTQKSKYDREEVTVARGNSCENHENPFLVIVDTYPKRLRKPNSSNKKPKNGYLLNTRKMPPRKQMVPRSFSRREKNTSVLLGPMMAAMPHRNKI